MKTSDVLSALRSHETFPVAFRHRDRTVAPGYHLTEVKRVRYETVDCGIARHDWTETHFEISTPPPSGRNPDREPMPARKFLAIVDRVEERLPLHAHAAARVHTSFAGEPSALYDIESIAAEGDRLWVDLIPDRTRCKAAERTSGAPTAGCSSGDHREGTEAPANGTAEPCGCGVPEATGARTVCCA